VDTAVFTVTAVTASDGTEEDKYNKAEAGTEGVEPWSAAR
jgi:hypothetical protein